MKMSKIWKGVAGLLFLMAAIALIPSLLSPPAATILVEMSQTGEENGTGTYQVSLTPEQETQQIEEAGIIVQTGDEESTVPASSDPNGSSWQASFTAPAGSLISVQPYVKYQGKEDTTVYEKTEPQSISTVISSVYSSVISKDEEKEADAIQPITVADTSELSALLEEAAGKAWNDGDVIEISFNGEASFDSEILLGQTTVFSQSGKKVPIVIDGGGKAVLNLTADKVASANDITFKNLSMPIGNTDMEIFAGSGNVVFENVDFGTKDGEGKAGFYGDTYTANVFNGWTKQNLNANKSGGLLPTSITFRGTTSYTPKQSPKLLMGAVGFHDDALEGSSTIGISPKSLDASFIVDGATVSFAGARADISPVAVATLSMTGGTAEALSADGMTYAIGSSETYEGETYLNVEGGKICHKEGIVAVTSAIHVGNVYVSISQTEVAKVQMTDRSEIRGSATLTLNGTTVHGDVLGATATVSSFNNILASTLEGNFYGVSSGSSRRITNTLSGTNVKGDFIGGNFAAGIVRGVTNTVTASTVEGDFIGANRSVNLYGKIINSISGTTKIGGKLTCGNANGSVSSTIKNTISSTSVGGGLVSGNEVGATEGSIQNTLNSVTVGSKLYGGNINGNTEGSITNTFTDISVTDLTFGGNESGKIAGNIQNTVSGNSVFHGFIGGNGKQGNIDGGIQNKISGGTFYGQAETVYNNYFDSIAATDISTVCFYGGSNSPVDPNGEPIAQVTDSITNEIKGGTFKNYWYAGNLMGKLGGSITNTITGGSFGTFQGGGYNSTITGSITNKISNGTFTGSFTAGNRGNASVNDQLLSTAAGITNEIKGGNFSGNNWFGGSFNGTVNGNIQNTVSGSNFSGNNWFGGSSLAKISGSITNEIKGGTFSVGKWYGACSNGEATVTNITNTFTKGSFSGVVYCGSASTPVSGTITNTFAGVTFTGDVYGGNASGAAKKTIQNTVSGGTFKSAFYGGNGNSTVSGAITNTFNGGTFQSNVYGGNAAGTVKGNIQNTYGNKTAGATFEASVYGGNKAGTASTVSGTAAQSTFNNLYPGNETSPDSVTSALLHIQIAKTDKLRFNGEVRSLSEKDTVKLTNVRSNIILGPQAHLVIDEYVSTGWSHTNCGNAEATQWSSGKYQPILPPSDCAGWEANHVYVEYPRTLRSYSCEKCGQAAVKLDPAINVYGSIVTDNELVGTEETAGSYYNVKFIGSSNYKYNAQETDVVVPTEPKDVPSEQKLTKAALDNIGIVKEDMSADELRDLAVKYFELQLSFAWTPDASQEKYLTTNLRGDAEDENGGSVDDIGVIKYIDQGALYGGIPYQSHGNGNLYRWMEYFDESNGVFYLSEMMKDNGGYSADGAFNPGSDYFYNQCSNGANWAWMRVCNTSYAEGSASFNVARGLIPVGGFTYEGNTSAGKNMATTTVFGSMTNSETGVSSSYNGKKVISELGEIKILGYSTGVKKIYDYYALVQKGDCISKAGHVMMAVEVNVETKDVFLVGTVIDPDKSTITVMEQIEGWALASEHAYDSSTGHDKAQNGDSTWNGYNYTRQGRLYTDPKATYTFTDLANAGYLPFTFIEFQDFNPETQEDLDKTHIQFYKDHMMGENGILAQNVLATRYSGYSNLLINEGKISVGDLVNVDTNGDLIGAVEKGWAKIALLNTTTITNEDDTTSKVYSTSDISSASHPKMDYTDHLKKLMVYSNYFISDVFATVTNPAGAILHQQIYRTGTNSVSMIAGRDLYSGTFDLVNRDNTITISVQLSTGELVELYSGLLVE